MADDFKGQSADLSSVGRSWAAITPNDAADVPTRPRFLIIGGAGNLSLVGSDGVIVVFAVTAGQVVPLSPVRVRSTGTTATGIIGVR